MAIINCPECKEKISSTSNQCIHCGAKFRICNECGKTFTGEPRFCTECGYVFEKYKNEHTNNQSSFILDIMPPVMFEKEKYKRSNEHFSPSVDTAGQVVEKWKNSNGFRKFLNSKILSFLLSCISLLFLTIMFVSILNSSQTFNGYLETIKATVIITSILECIHLFWKKNKEIVLITDYLAWSKRKSIDQKDIIQKTFSQDFSDLPHEVVVKHSKALNYAVIAELRKNEPVARNIFWTLHIVSIVITILSAILFDIALISNFENYIILSLLQGTELVPDLSMIINWALIIIPAVLIYVVEPIISHKLRENIDRSGIRWFNKYLPEHTFKYQKYVLEFDEDDY